MTSPRSYDGVGYPSPSFSSGTPIYDSLVAERGVPQIAPINVPAALPPATYGSGYSSSYGSGYGTGFDSPAASNLPALPPARLALGPGPSSGPATSYIPAQSAPSMYGSAPQPAVPGYGGQQPYLPPQRPQTPTFPSPQGGYQAGQSFGGQNSFASAPTGMTGQFGAQGFGQGQQQGFADQSFGGNQLRPAAPVAPVRPVQQQYPGPAYYPQAG